MRELKSGMPQLDPCCFPVLHPRGTLGWRWFMKRNSKGAKDEEIRMQEELDWENQQEVHEMFDAEDDTANKEAEFEEEDGAPIDEEENNLDADDDGSCDNADEPEDEQNSNSEEQMVSIFLLLVLQI